jgi:hypothetical protein
MSGKPQEIGSALTYARRYSLSALIGIAADEDDDANAAQKKNGDGELISGQQFVDLSALLDNDPERITKFCNLQRINTLEDMPAHRFDEAVKYIKKVNDKIKAKDNAAGQ